MANINIRIDDNLKNNAFMAFERMGLSPSDAVRAFLEYVATTGKMPIKQVLVSEDEDNDLYALVKKRINEPHKFKETTLDDLFNKGAWRF